MIYRAKIIAFRRSGGSSWTGLAEHVTYWYELPSWQMLQDFWQTLDHHIYGFIESYSVELFNDEEEVTLTTLSYAVWEDNWRPPAPEVEEETYIVNYVRVTTVKARERSPPI